MFKDPVEGKVLPGHVIRTEKVANIGSCRKKCFLEPNCESINVGPADHQGQRTCELNNFRDESPSQTKLQEKTGHQGPPGLGGGGDASKPLLYNFNPPPPFPTRRPPKLHRIMEKSFPASRHKLVNTMRWRPLALWQFFNNCSDVRITPFIINEETGVIIHRLGYSVILLKTRINLGNWI